MRDPEDVVLEVRAVCDGPGDPETKLQTIATVLARAGQGALQGALFATSRPVNGRSRQPNQDQLQVARRLIGQFTKATGWRQGVPRSVLYQTARAVALGRGEALERRLRGLERVMSNSKSFRPPHPDSWFGFEGWTRFAKYDSEEQVEERRPNRDRAAAILAQRIKRRGGSK